MGLKLYVNYLLDTGRIVNYAERPEETPLEVEPGCAVLVVDPVEVVFKGNVKMNDRYPDLERKKVVDGALVDM